MSDDRINADLDLGEEWEELAIRIHRCRTATGRAPVFGADHCQRCGTLTPFATVATAQAVHLGADGDRVCDDCLRREGVDGALAALAEGRLRCCERCGGAVPRDPQYRVGEVWMCTPCAAVLCDEPHQARAAVLALLRRRYMVLGFPTLELLHGLERAVLAMTAQLDAIDRAASQLNA